jgi:hypothetical protein
MKFSGSSASKQRQAKKFRRKQKQNDMHRGIRRRKVHQG